MLRLHGQQLPVQTLERSLAEGRLHHAYLFTGPAHLGKATLAVQFAQALNCDADDASVRRLPELRTHRRG